MSEIKKTGEGRCVFCSNRDVQARMIAENPLAWAFPTNIPITPGHTLVVPKRCVPSLRDLSSEERMAILELSDAVMDACRRAHGAEGFNCAWNQGTLAGQSVPHFHLHVVPRAPGDTGLLGYDPRSMLYRTGDREPVSDEALRDARDALRRELRYDTTI